MLCVHFNRLFIKSHFCFSLTSISFSCTHQRFTNTHIHMDTYDLLSLYAAQRGLLCSSKRCKVACCSFNIILQTFHFPGSFTGSHGGTAQAGLLCRDATCCLRASLCPHVYTYCLYRIIHLSLDPRVLYLIKRQH